MQKNLIWRKISLFALVAVLCFQLIVSAFPTVARAEDNKNIYTTSISEDFASLGIDEMIYPTYSSGKVDLIYFTEFCFSKQTSYLDDGYNLFFWLYNPTEEAISKVTVDMAISGGYSQVELTPVATGRSNRFYKFCLKDPASILEKARSLYDAEKYRSYSLNKLSITFTDGKTEQAEINTAYTFTGFSKGCDPSTTLESTLSVKFTGIDNIHLKLFHTTYRGATDDGERVVYLTPDGKEVQPEGLTYFYIDENGKKVTVDATSVIAQKVYNYNRDALTTVYFSLPDKYFDKYDDLSEITAEWYEYKTAPIFVTSNVDAYREIMGLMDYETSWIGKTVYSGNKELTRSILWEEADAEYKGDGTKYTFAKWYNGKASVDGEERNLLPINYRFAANGSRLSRLDFLFLIEGKIESLDDYNISSSVLENYMKEYTANSGSSSLVAGQFDIKLFSHRSIVDFDENTFDIIYGDVLYPADIGRKLGKNSMTKVSMDIIKGFETVGEDTRTWWDKLWGADVPTEMVDVEPIYVFTDQDVKTLKHIDAENEEHISWFEKKYFIENDNTNAESGSVIKEMKRMLQNGERPVLFRFAVTDYYSAPAYFEDTNDYWDSNGNFQNGDGVIGEYENGYKPDGYVAQETVFLNFDVISLGFDAENEGRVVLPVVADPINIISGLIPPEDLTVENDEWWQKLVMILMLIVLLVILSPILTPLLTVVLNLLITIFGKAFGAIGGFLWKVITAPVRFFVWLFRRR